MENYERNGKEGKRGKAEGKRLSRKLQRRPRSLKFPTPASVTDVGQDINSHSESLHWKHETDTSKRTTGLVVVDSKTLPRSQQMLDSKSQKVSDIRSQQMPDPRSQQMLDPRSQQMSDSKKHQIPDPRPQQMSDPKSEQMLDPRSQQMLDPRSQQMLDPRSQQMPDLRKHQIPHLRLQQISDMRSQQMSDLKSEQMSNPRIPQMPDPRAQQSSDKTPRCSWMGWENMESSTDDAYFSEMSCENSVKALKFHNRETMPPSHNQKHLKITRKQSSITDATLICGSPRFYENDNINQNAFIKNDNFNIHTRIAVPKDVVDGKNNSGCHCQACCSCHGNISSGGCVHHPKACKKCSDSTSADNSQVTEADSSANLPSPTSINSWGHFCKTTQNCYKYRRSDYSSESDDDLPVNKDKNSASQITVLCHQKSHLPKITVSLSRQSSASSTKSATERSGSMVPDVNLPINEGVPPSDFKDRITTILKWFSDFNDEQKNLVLKEILNGCDLPQIHLLSVKMQANLHHGCPPNCQDLITWLPTNQAARIMAYLDPVSLCRSSQVCKMWHQLTDEPSLWRRFCCQQKWRLSKAAEHKQVISHMSPQGSIQWKKVFAERFRLRNNWLRGRCTVRTFEGHSQGISCVQFDDSRIVSGSSDKTIKVWNIRTNAQWSVQTLVGHSGTVRCLHLEGNRLVSGSTDCMIKVWDLSAQESWSSIACKVTMTGHSNTVRCLQVDDQKVVSGSYDKTLKIWDINSGRCKLTLRGHQAAVLCVHFNDTKVVSGSCDKTIKVWNYEGTCMRTLCGHQDAVTCLQFDATRIVSGSLDCNLKFWDIHSGECVNTIDWKAAEGHTGVVRCLQADNWRLVSAADDKTIKVWNLETGKRLVTLRNHTDGVTCLQFNDFIIVSGSYDKTVKLWDFSSC